MPELVGHLAKGRVFIEEASVVPECGIEFGLEFVEDGVGLDRQGSTSNLAW